MLTANTQPYYSKSQRISMIRQHHKTHDTVNCNTCFLLGYIAQLEEKLRGLQNALDAVEAARENGLNYLKDITFND